MFQKCYCRYVRRLLGGVSYGRGSWVVGTKSWVVGRGYKVVGHGSWVVGRGSWVVGTKSWVVRRQTTNNKAEPNVYSAIAVFN